MTKKDKVYKSSRAQKQLSYEQCADKDNVDKQAEINNGSYCATAGFNDIKRKRTGLFYPIKFRKKGKLFKKTSGILDPFIFFWVEDPGFRLLLMP